MPEGIMESDTVAITMPLEDPPISAIATRPCCISLAALSVTQRRGSCLKIVCRQKTRSVTNGHDVDRIVCDAINDPITSLKNLTVCVAVVFTEPAANGWVRGQ